MPVEAPAPAPRSSIATSVVAEDPVGTVLGHRGNDAIVDLGSAQGLMLGTLVELYALEPVDLGDGELAYERRALAVGRVIAVSQGRCLVELGSNEQVPVGAKASPRRSGHPTTSIWAPPRAGGVWEIGVSARAFAVTSALGGGLLADGYVGYRGQRPFFVRARLDPSGLTVHRESRSDSFHAASAGGGLVMAGVDHRFFAFGAGFGLTRVLPTRATSCTYDSSSTRSCTVTREPAHAGFTFGLHVRVGASDGLSLSADVAFTSVRQRSELSLLDLRAQVPATQTLAFTLRVATGFHVTGASLVDFGARMRARGDGGSGSLFVTPFLGWSHLSGGVSVDYGYGSYGDGYERLASHRSGPSAGVSLEYRR